MDTLIHEKVYFKIFDKRFAVSTQVYGQYRSKDPAKQQEARNNCAAVANDLNVRQLLILKQVHGVHVVDADYINDYTHEPEADGAVTTLANIAIGIQTADCVPVLLADKAGEVVGAAHCGWKSAKADIIERLVDAMRKKGATDICAIIGPSIQQDSYEVDEVFFKSFRDAGTRCEDLFIPSKNEGRYMFDLPGYIRRKLDEANVELLKHIQEDTYKHPEKYHSYRRDCHTGVQCGPVNMLSTIVIRD